MSNNSHQTSVLTICKNFMPGREEMSIKIPYTSRRKRKDK